MERSAIIDGNHRLLLTRTWDASKLPVVWIMLNPSTADAETDDPTIRRCINYSKSWGGGGIKVVNLYTYRATDPEDLRRAGYPIHDDAERVIASCIEPGSFLHTVCAWGTKGELGRMGEILGLLRFKGCPLEALKVTKQGYPSHPLYLKAALTPQPYIPASGFHACIHPHPERLL